MTESAGPSFGVRERIAFFPVQAFHAIEDELRNVASSIEDLRSLTGRRSDSLEDAIAELDQKIHNAHDRFDEKVREAIAMLQRVQGFLKAMNSDLFNAQQPTAAGPSQG